MDDLVLTPDELEEYDDWLDWEQSKYEGMLASMIDEEPEKEKVAETEETDDLPF